MNPQKIVFWILIFIATVIGLFQLRSCEIQTKDHAKDLTVTVKMIDVRQSSNYDLLTTEVKIVLDTPTRLVFDRHFRVRVKYWVDQDAVSTYSYDRSTGVGTWTQTFPELNGTFQMFPEGDAWRIVQMRSNGEFLTESLLMYSY